MVNSLVLLNTLEAVPTIGEKTILKWILATQLSSPLILSAALSRDCSGFLLSCYLRLALSGPGIINCLCLMSENVT